MKILTSMHVEQHTLTPCILSQTTEIFTRWPEERSNTWSKQLLETELLVSNPGFTLPLKIVS